MKTGLYVFIRFGKKCLAFSSHIFMVLGIMVQDKLDIQIWNKCVEKIPGMKGTISTSSLPLECTSE